MQLAIRWIVGDVSARGYEVLAHSITGARAVFGDAPEYVVCVNTIDVNTARARVGRAARLTDWKDCSGLTPTWLRERLDEGMAEGVAWKFAPPRIFPNRHLLSLDNDVVLWRMPASVRAWLDDSRGPLIAEDVRCCYGRFADRCPRQPRNSGITGFPPGWNVEGKLRETIGHERLTSETDEQGLQVAMITAEPHHVVSMREVSICGYFRPHLLEFGSCGAHFVGVNAKRSSSMWAGRSCHQFTYEFWDTNKPEVARLVAQAHPVW